MYQGAYVTGGAERRPNARSSSSRGRSGNAKKSRGRGAKRKKNPGVVTWILIAGATAAVAGGGIAYTMYRKKKKQQLLPGNGGVPRPGIPTTTQKQNAPNFPYTEAQAKKFENSMAASVVNDGYDFEAKTFTKNEGQLTDAGFYRIYNIRKIPDKRNRGTGWQPYIDSWLRLRESVRLVMAELEQMNEG